MVLNATDSPDLSTVTDLSWMFYGATAFNGAIGGWEVSNVTDMSSMFWDADAFNQDIGGWDVSNVTDMSFMFVNATVFNQDIGTWNVSNVTDMSFMFSSAASFDQDISGWDVSNVIDFEDFLSSAELSPENYSALLIAWEQLDLQDGLIFDAGSSQYAVVAEDARQAIITGDGWTINDGGLAPEASVTKTVSNDGIVDFGATGADINFFGVSGSGEVTVERFANAPSGTDGISETNVSKYRLVITTGCCLSFGSSTELRFPVGAFGGITDPETVTVYKRSSEGTGSFTALSTSVENNGTPGDISDDVLIAITGSFSEFVLASDSNPLPVELTSFDVQIDDETVHLTWRTASEVNNTGFEVQRHTGGASTGRSTLPWESIGFVEGTGTTSEPQHYRFADSDLPYEAETLTYRLKQVDTDGTFEYSSEVEVELGMPERLALHGNFPNPFRDRTTIRYELPKAAHIRLAVYNVVGQQVATLVNEQKEAGRHALTFAPQDLPSGVYFVRLTSAGAALTQRITIVR